ncbi:MAG: hypothetical protein C0606_12290 [Hyphomicrobiales bacterium]|nr:MAG: hypothetical protein C0606_12290 [Hyphomicrobiales bacterium]
MQLNTRASRQTDSAAISRRRFARASGIALLLASALAAHAAEPEPLTLYQIGETLTYSHEDIVTIRHERDERNEAIDQEFTITEAAAARQKAFTGALVGKTIGLVFDGRIGSDNTIVREPMGLTIVHTFMPDTPEYEARANALEARHADPATSTSTSGTSTSGTPTTGNHPLIFLFERKAKVELTASDIESCTSAGDRVELRLHPSALKNLANLGAEQQAGHWLLTSGDIVVNDWRTGTLTASGIFSAATLAAGTVCPK